VITKIQLHKKYLEHLQKNADVLQMSCPEWDVLTWDGYNDERISKILNAVYLKMREFIDKIGESFPEFKWSSLMSYDQWIRSYKLDIILQDSE